MASVLAGLLTERTIKLKAHASDWRMALRLGGQLLVDSGGVEPRYVDAMIQTMLDFGPYVVIAPGLALGHARPEAGVLRTCFSLVTLDSPVEFGVPENDPVDVIFSFGAPDKNAHLEALRQMAALCSDEANMRAIRAATHPSEVIALLNRQ